jgi:CRISPR-associated endonuclease/helicase Cas3
VHADYSEVEMIALEAGDFSKFFEQVYGFAPFPWQVRLASAVCETGQFPAVLDLPTGSGKTSCIDIALFHLAYDLANQGTRKAALRIAWVVDRRLIVDDVYDRASVIAAKLDEATDGILKDIADLFREIAGDGAPPLVVERLRGGIPREGDWSRTPTQPTVVSSTVDQVGSRLLFRGYGVRDEMRSIQAGLFGEDALLILDEVHLSEPFRQTLDRISTYPRKIGTWSFVQLSATPRAMAIGSPFMLDEQDYSNGVLARRLQAAKPARLVRLGRIQKFGSDEHAEHFAREAIACVDLDASDAPKNILIVVNRVALARRVHEKIEFLLKKQGREAVVTRLVGRGRDIEKDEIRNQVVSRCKSDPLGARKSSDGKPFFVVATQTIEAGADLDFDALITQIAPIDALRQRFGRLNRMGRSIRVAASILAADSEIAPSAKADPIYEFASRNTWLWLEAQTVGSPSSVDFASDAMKVDPEILRSLGSPAPDAPVLMPEHMKALSRTSPAPPWSPDASLYLHGSPNSPADVNVVWRADFADLTGGAAEVTKILALVPPRMGEVVAMPVGTVRRWLRGEDLSDVADLEVDTAPSAQDGPGRGVKVCWRWLGANADSESVTDGNVRPGDTVVVSSRLGGCDRFGWNPQQAEVVDVADAAAYPYRSRTFSIRLQPSVIAQIVRSEADLGSTDMEIAETSRRLWTAIKKVVEDNQDRPKALLSALIGDSKNDGINLPEGLRARLEQLREAKSITLELPYGTEGDEQASERGVVLFARRGLRCSPKVRAAARVESATEGDGVGSVGAGSPLSLAQHSRDVRRFAAAFADRLQLPRPLSEDLALAGYLHDIGKADLRFQRYLAGQPWGISVVLAKSGKRRSSREDAMHREAAALPRAWRHEALSVRIARKHPEFAQAHDPELVLWLIGTHHGYGRPRFPHAEPRDNERVSFSGFEPFVDIGLDLEPSAGPQRLDFTLKVATSIGMVEVDWPMIFARLEERYGIWGLARLEAILRLADHRASESADIERQVVLA